MIIAVDPILKSPLLSTIFLAVASGLLGCIFVSKQQSLFGETVSHASYPGFIIGALIAEVFAANDMLMYFLFLGAFLTSVGAIFFLHFLIKQMHVPEDAAQTALISATFSCGVLIFSAFQTIYPQIFRVIQVMLVGQASTMGDRYISLSFIIAFFVMVCIWMYYRGLVSTLFDRDFSCLSGIEKSFIQKAYGVLLIMCILLCCRIMGVVLMSALLIFPTISARLLVRSFSAMLCVAAVISAVAGCMGVYISHKLTIQHGETIAAIPTGPFITFILGCIFISIYVFSPIDGLLMQWWRRWSFQKRTVIENGLKIGWKLLQEQGGNSLTKEKYQNECGLSSGQFARFIRNMDLNGYFIDIGDEILFLPKGICLGKKLVRLHRLWELYLVTYCRFPKEKVHPCAEEIEHIVTDEVEKKLTSLLQNPLLDPHNRPIPQPDRYDAVYPVHVITEDLSYVSIVQQFFLKVLYCVISPGIRMRKWFLLKKASKRVVKSFVILVGNVSYGGTGKTPFIEKLIRDTFGEWGYVSRGYKRRDTGLYVTVGSAFDVQKGGDEAALLAKRHPEIVFAIDTSKWKAVCAIQEKCSHIIVDDGLQRYDIPHDVSVGLVCGMYPFGRPKGLLRESFSRLSLVDYVVVTNAAYVDPDVKKKIEALHVPVVWTEPRIDFFFDDAYKKVQIPVSKKVALFSGIANPQRFYQSIHLLGYTIVDHLTLVDHDPLVYDHVLTWVKKIRNQFPDVVCIGTEKDFVRQTHWNIQNVYFAHLSLQVISGNDVYQDLLKRILKGKCR